jgi:hypothetical protein
MWPMFTNSLRLFLKGKLFRDPKAVGLRWFAGFAMAFAAVVLLGLLGVPVWLAVVLASLAVGVIQPYLFRDLKYA